MAYANNTPIRGASSRWDYFVSELRASAARPTANPTIADVTPVIACGVSEPCQTNAPSTTTIATSTIAVGHVMVIE